VTGLRAHLATVAFTGDNAALDAQGCAVAACVARHDGDFAVGRNETGKEAEKEQ